MVSTALITPIHTRVPGRARLEVQGLYHSAALKRRLESALTAAPEIRQIEANTRTGRVLVVFDAALALAAVCALIEAQLQVPGRRALPNRTLGRRSSIRRFDVAPVLQGLAAALRTLPSVLQSRPVLGATSATAAAAANAAKRRSCRETESGVGARCETQVAAASPGSIPQDGVPRPNSAAIAAVSSIKGKPQTQPAHARSIQSRSPRRSSQMFTPVADTTVRASPINT